MSQQEFGPITRCPFCNQFDSDAEVRGCTHCRAAFDYIRNFVTTHLGSQFEGRSILDVVVEYVQANPPPKTMPVSVWGVGA